jgi:two-component system, chemotaxis family, protein-glutamate methylesterase/glutaminase
VVVVGSAGGLAAAERVLADLSEVPAPVLLMLHLSASHPSMLAPLMAKHTRLPVNDATDGEQIASGVIYTAPPGHHLLVEARGVLRLSTADPVRFHRPSADLLLESAAEAFGAGVVAAVLSGAGTDGAAGVRAVKRAGGWVVVQDPATAAFLGMPRAAVETGLVDEVVPLERVGECILRALRGAPHGRA